MRMRLTLLFGAVTVLTCLPVAAVAQWTEDFDSYADGELLYQVGGWSGWDDNPDYAGVVSSVQSLSAPHSIEIAGAADAVHPFTGVDSGTWTFTGSMYIPSDLTSLTALIVQNLYSHGGDKQWAAEIHFDPATDTVWDAFRDPGQQNALPIIYDRWAEIRLEMDFDNDYVEQYYDGQLLESGVWTFYGGPVAFANLDLYAWGSSAVYYDDLSLIPEPAACVLLALLAGVALRRR